MKNITLCLLLLVINYTANSQSRHITGRLVDDENNYVQYATIVLQTVDSVYINGTISDSLGQFSLRSELDVHSLIVDHISYKTKKVLLSNENLGSILMEQKNLEIGSVNVVGERPLVKVNSDGALSYNIDQLTKNRVVTNAYDAIQELPGIREQNGVIALVGAPTLTVIINGKPSTMSETQLIDMLKQMPVSNVESAEVMYSTPPQYHTRGAAINLILRSIDPAQSEPSIQGEVMGLYNQQNYSNYSTGGSLLYKTDKISADLLYSFTDNKSNSRMDIISQHAIDGLIHNVEQYTTGIRESQTHTGRLAIDYRPRNKSLLSFVYNTSVLAKDNDSENSIGNFSKSESLKEKSNQFHNLSFDYTSGSGFKIGADYTYYRTPRVQYFSDIDTLGKERGFTSRTLQNINALTLYADREHQLKREWKLTYGAKFSYANDYDYQKYDDTYGDVSLTETENTIEEYISVAYAGFSKSFSERLSMNFSLMGEHYKLEDDQEFTLFPQSQITYTQSPKSIFQLSISSDKVYPSYWERQDYESYINGYALGYGNPELKPYNNYSAQFTYIRSSKYIFSLYYNYQPDFSSQLIYQSPDELSMIYKTENWDYNKVIGVSSMTPFSIGGWLNSNLTLNGYYQRSKYDNYYDIGFDHSKFVGYAALDNTINISSKPDIKLNISAYYMSDMMQGIFDMSNLWGLNAGVKWRSNNKKMELNLKATDICNSSDIDISVHDRGQNFNVFVFPDSRSLELSFSYKFGGYKSLQRKQIDKSRLKP